MQDDNKKTSEQSSEVSIPTTTIPEPISMVKQTYTQAQVNLITRTVARGATPDELKLFLVVAKRSGLDPFVKQIHFVKRGGQGVIQVGIDGLRTIAERSGELAGIDDAEYDTEDEKYPGRATVTVYRIVKGLKVGFTASARWSEYCPPEGQDFMWKKMPYLMLAKCAEALALRKAFPNDLSGLYTDDEMHQAGPATIDADAAPVVNATQPSVRQMEYIDNMMLEKQLTKADLIDAGFNYDELTGGRDGTASELITYLQSAKSKVGPTGQTTFTGGEPVGDEPF